jgi:hydroxyacylglutathione hydrolase
MQQMVQSLNTLNALPSETLIYCGHEYTENNLRFAGLVEPNNQEIPKRLTQVQQQRNAGVPSVPAPLSLERATNPFLRCDQPEVIAAAANYSHKKQDTPTDVFAVLRDWKNHYS